MSERRNIADHYELLIRLDENMISMMREFKKMQEQSQREMREMRQHHKTEIEALGKRVISVEQFRAEQSLDRKVDVWDESAEWVQDVIRHDKDKMWTETAEWVSDVRKSWKLLITVVTFLAATIAYALSVLRDTM